ncbi:MAG: glycine--tRNA ligase subunit beta [Pseudomonadota bacterium]|nr:glycine--tRNA ligase subunit beta [Pseudomonadota bacterium]
MNTRDLLIEIGTEELPPKALANLSAALELSLTEQLQALELSFGNVQRFASPRRLAVLIEGLDEAQEDQEKTRLGPAIPAAFDDTGAPTPAARGFAKSCGVEVDQLSRTKKNGVEKLSFSVNEKGRATQALVPTLIEAALSKLPIPKRMRWGSSRIEFVRPLHWAVVLFGEETIETDILGVRSGHCTRGHRVHNNQDLPLVQPSDYESVLKEQGRVIASFDKRRDLIREQVEQQARMHEAVAIIDEALLDEVTSLVEFPVALTGSFDEAFLAVPQEALILAMKSHQKCFHLADAEGRLLPKFVAISNLESKDPQQVITGNERVIRPRLADAQFFFDTDREKPLITRKDSLGSLVFQDRLGTVLHKCERVSQLSRQVAEQVSADPAHCMRAAELSKCDLLTSMVGEFADLQGLMGSYYAANDGEASEVAQAIHEQYQPRFAGDDLPASETGAILAVADKLDTMVGLFGIGQPPTGSKDPFALRRSAIGILRILVEKPLELDLKWLIKASVESFPDDLLLADTGDKVFEFILERFRAWYLDEGISSEEFQSVFALRPSRPLDFHRRIQAVHAFAQMPEAQSLAAANKRVANILSKQASAAVPPALSESLLQESAEKTLYAAIIDKESEVAPYVKQGDYQKGLTLLAELKPAIDGFFDEVLVMAEDEAVRDNRLALLAKLQALFLNLADISHLTKS